MNYLFIFNCCIIINLLNKPTILVGKQLLSARSALFPSYSISSKSHFYNIFSKILQFLKMNF